MGVVTARIVGDRGELVGALLVLPDDEVFAITSAGGVIRTAASEVKMSGRQTMGVRLMNLAHGDSVVAIARNAEAGPVVEGDPANGGAPETPDAAAGDVAGEAGGVADQAGDAADQVGGEIPPPEATHPGGGTS
jgi:DNA gyrase subunit A